MQVLLLILFSFCLPPSHQTNTHPEYAGPATTLTCCFAKALVWGRQSKPSVFIPCSKTSHILLQLAAPSQGRAMCWTFPFIPAGAKAGSGIYLPSLFLEKIKTTGHLVVLYCRPGLCHVVLPQPHLFSFLITSEPKQLTHAHAPCSPRESAPSLADHTLLQLVKLERSSSGWLGPWAAFQSPSHPQIPAKSAPWEPDTMH